MQLKSDSGDLVIHCDEDLYDEALLSALRRHKPALLTLARRNGDDWWQPACAITPDMLPLVALEETHIASIVGNLPGGAANVQDIYPLAPLQEGMLFHYLLARDGDPYLRDALFGFDSRARLDAFLAALGHVIDRHDILRTAIQWEGVPQPVQVVWYSAPLPVEEIELDAANGDVAQQLHERFDTRQVRLDLNRAPLLRAIVAYDSAQDRWLMLMLFHHLAIDHTALAEVEREVHAYLADAAAQLPEPVPFRNYVAQARLGVSRDEHEAFFREMLGDVDEPTLPFGLRDVRDDGRDIEEAHAVLDAALARRLRVQARQAGVGVASLFHVAWAHVLARASGREDVVFGTVLFGRMQGGGGTERALGMFINTLPVRVDAGRTGTREAVANTHRLLSRLLRHEHASLSLAQRCSGIVAPTPLFSALLNYRHGAASTDSVAWPGIQSLDSSGRTNYPLVLSVDDHDDGLALTVQVTAELDAVRIGAYMTVALDSLATALESNPRRPVKDLPMLPAAEREQVLNAWNRTEADYPRDAALHTLFEAQVERTPEAIALIHEGVALSYAALNARANRIAHALIARGVGPDARVAICVERSIGMVVGLLGILKAGAAYVPLDPAYPPQRLAYMLEDCGPAVLLTQSSVCGTLPVHDIDTLCLDDDRAVFDGMPENNPRHRSLPDHLAYVIYTSGSTGLPKGVTVTHRNGVRLFATTRTDFDFTGDDVWTLFHSFAFDFSVWEIWGALLFGGRLVIVPKTVAQSAEAFYALVCDAGVTVLNQTPGAFRQLIAAQRTGDAAHRLRYVVFGGEALDTAMLKPWYDDRRNAATRLVNMYGITETTVHVSYRPLDAADAHRTGSSPIGRPLADLGAYLLDGAHEPVPRGVAGELYIAGAGLARGYLNRADLTAERFVPDPFGVAGARMYRTGDLARHLPDGNLEYLGRNDDQVKLRGFRIELGEIGARLARCPGVRDAVVIAREDASGDKRLVAYYTGESCETESLREHLLAGLPEYMVPAAYVYLEALPLTPNSKLDRKALPAPDVHAYALKEYEAPRGSVEIALAQIWSKLLDVEQVGRQDNFFELGGHSLLAIGVIERMQRAGWRTDVTALFNAPTLAALAETIDAARREGGTAALHTAHV
ncbi:non-ribosomal peptide synthetase, partial [Burkholderia stagnalis]